MVNKVKIKGINAQNDFLNAHGTLSVNGKLYIGTRSSGRFVCYNVPYGDIGDVTIIDIPIAGDINGKGVENLCYDATNNRLYATISNTNMLIDINADDITDYNITVYSTGLTCGIFLASGVCLTDDTYIYVFDESTTGYKIRISDKSIVVTNDQMYGAHSGQINVLGGVAYISQNGSIFSKVNLSDLSFSYIDTGYSSITDDMVWDNSYGFNMIILGQEFRDSNNTGGVVINADDMTFKNLDMMPSLGVFYEPIYGIVYNLSLDGFIETFNMLDIASYFLQGAEDLRFMSKVYTFGNFLPNECMFVNRMDENNELVDVDIYITVWNNTEGGSLMRVKLKEADNTLMTKKEFKYRANQ